MKYILVACSILFGISHAYAETFNRTVPANKSSTIGANATYNRGTCLGSIIPTFKITKAPKHGKVTFKQATFKLSEKAGRCASKTVKGTAIYYRPNSGYRGKDTFKISYKYIRDDHSGRQVYNVDKYNINIK